MGDERGQGVKDEAKTTGQCQSAEKKLSTYIVSMPEEEGFGGKTRSSDLAMLSFRWQRGHPSKNVQQAVRDAGL